MKTIIPLYGAPSANPTGWADARSVLAPGDVAIVGAAFSGIDPAVCPVGEATLRGLTAAGVITLGYVDMAFAGRRLAELLADIEGWARHPLSGIFLDQCPVTPFAIGPVAIACQAIRRAGLAEIMLNPGGPVDPLYRGLGATICTFEGPWAGYASWDGDCAYPGDAHLVYDVPLAQTAAARELIAERRAGYALVTDWDAPDPYGNVPQWCTLTHAT